MKPESLPPLPESVSTLLDAERAAGDSAPVEVRADLTRRLASLALPTTSTRPPMQTALGKAAIAKVAALVVASGVAGSVLTLALRPSPKRQAPPSTEDTQAAIPPETPAPTEPPPAPHESLVAPHADPSDSADATPPSLPSVPRAGTTRSRTAPPDVSLGREGALLEAARAAVAHRDGIAALNATEDHRRQFPNGQLAEEREALAVQGLMLADRPDDARARAQEFRKRYPNGLFLPIVLAAIGQ